jgi:hypothetical protein
LGQPSAVADPVARHLTATSAEDPADKALNYALMTVISVRRAEGRVRER